VPSETIPNTSYGYSEPKHGRRWTRWRGRDGGGDSTKMPLSTIAHVAATLIILGLGPELVACATEPIDAAVSKATLAIACITTLLVYNVVERCRLARAGGKSGRWPELSVSQPFDARHRRGWVFDFYPSLLVTKMEILASYSISVRENSTSNDCAMRWRLVTASSGGAQTDVGAPSAWVPRQGPLHGLLQQ
jgi:hypothetical protein